jgi:hypothetical protein
VLVESQAVHSQLFVDWDALGAALVNLTVGAIGKERGHHVEFALKPLRGEHAPFTLCATLRDAAGQPRPIHLDTVLFSAESDHSATKYGASGIELALANKYIGLLGGTLEASDGAPELVFTLPQGGQEKADKKLAA